MPWGETSATFAGPLDGGLVQDRRDGLHLECLDDVALLDIAVVLEANATLVAMRDLTGIVLESA